MNPVSAKLGRPSKLPSVESQTLAFVEWARARPTPEAAWLEWDGTRVYLRHWPHSYLPAPWQDLEVLVIANVQLPEQYQRRGWFWRYCQLCAALSRGAIAIESVRNKDLLAALRRHPEFVEYQPAAFLLSKPQPDDWPLKLDWLDIKDDPQFVARHRNPDPKE